MSPLSDLGTIIMQQEVAGMLILLIPLLVAVLWIAGMWKTFEKAGEPGWAAIIPIYNLYVLVAKVAGRSILWVIICFFFPIILIVPYLDVAKAFGKGVGYAVGLFFIPFIFFLLLGFGDDQYQGTLDLT